MLNSKLSIHNAVGKIDLPLSRYLMTGMVILGVAFLGGFLLVRAATVDSLSLEGVFASQVRDTAAEERAVMLGAEDRAIRHAAIQELSVLGSETATDRLIEFFGKDEYLATDGLPTAQALGRMGTPQAINALVEGLGEGQPPARQYVAMTGLEEAGESAVEPLIAALGSEDAVLRRNAAEMLGWIASPRAFDPLLSALSDASPEVRKQAAWALGEVDALRAIPHLSKLQAEEEDAAVREWVAEALTYLYRKVAQSTDL
ncbi:MAG: HEAT repeat domain-containing protein [Anaerolineae bacterium]